MSLLDTVEPDAQAIEAAAYMRAAEVCEKLRASIIPCDQFESGKQDSAYGLKQRILALIPQDGRTALRELLLELGEEVRYGQPNEDVVTIVNNLIGVQPLSSEGEKDS